MEIGLSSLLMTLFKVSQETAKEMTNSITILAGTTFLIMVVYLLLSHSPHWKNFKAKDSPFALAIIVIFTGVSSANAYLIAMILVEAKVAQQLPSLLRISILMALYMFVGLNIAKLYVKEIQKDTILPVEFSIYLRQAFVSIFALFFIALAISSVNGVISIFSNGSIILQWKGLLKWLFVGLGTFLFGIYFFAIAYRMDNVVELIFKIMPFQKKLKRRKSNNGNGENESI